MRNAAIAGVFALATMGMSSALADDVRGRGEVTRPAVQAGFVLTEEHIARLKNALNLSAAQERYWPAVEAALHNIMRLRGSWEERGSRGFLQYLSNRAGAYSYQAAGLNRLMSAAMPLIKTLDEGQKREAMKLARAVGLQAIPVSF